MNTDQAMCLDADKLVDEMTRILQCRCKTRNKEHAARRAPEVECPRALKSTSRGYPQTLHDPCDADGACWTARCTCCPAFRSKNNGVAGWCAEWADGRAPTGCGGLENPAQNRRDQDDAPRPKANGPKGDESPWGLREVAVLVVGIILGVLIEYYVLDMCRTVDQRDDDLDCELDSQDQKVYTLYDRIKNFYPLVPAD